MQEQHVNHYLGKRSLFKLKHLASDTWTPIQHDKDTQWVAELLSEFVENHHYLPEENQIRITGKAKKGFRQDLGEYLLFDIRLWMRFARICVSSGEDMQDELDLEIEAAFIEHSLRDNQFQDAIEIALENRIYELFFYKNREADVKAMLQELIQLNLDPYPRLQS